MSVFGNSDVDSAEKVAESAIRAVGADLLYVPIGDGTADLAAARVQRVLESLNALASIH